LAESEWRLHLTINTIPTMAWSTTPDGLIDFCNQNFVDYVGWTAEEISGQGFWPIFHPDDTAHLLASWQEILATKRPRDVEGRIRRADGQYRWFVLRQNPLLDADGNVIKWYGAGADIEDRKRAETALEEAQAALLASEQNLNLIINSLPVLVWSARPDGSADFINQSWRDYAGAPADKILEWGFLDLYHPDDVGGHEGDLGSGIWRPPTRPSLKGRIRGADGQYRWFYFAGRKLTDANGVVRWFGCNVDIEDLQRAEDALRESEAALRESEQALSLTISTIPAMVWSTKPDGMLDSWNQPFLDFAGVAFEEIEGDGFYRLFHPEDVEHLHSVWNEIVDSKRPKETEGRMRGRDGEYRWFTFRQSPLLDNDGNVLKWYGIVVDIEDRKRAEEALRGSEAALRDNERRLEHIINAVPGLVWSADADGAITFLSQQYLDYIGQTRLRPWPAPGWTPSIPKTPKRLLGAWVAGLGRRPRERTRSAPATRGRQLPLDALPREPVPRRDRKGGGMVRRQYRRRGPQGRARRAARQRGRAAESERQLQQIVSSIPGLTWSSDAHGATTFWSQQYLDYAGAKLEDVLGFGFVDYIHPDDRAHILETGHDPRHGRPWRGRAAVAPGRRGAIGGS
jgi:PAS domain S-box-containing protein